MNHPRCRRLVALLTLALVCAVSLPAVASAATPSRQLRVNVTIKRFVVTKAGLRALGTASANLAGRDARRQVTFSVSRSASCSILTLELQDLQLKLLGLNLDTSAINLRITGDSSRTLGALFCRLSKSLKLASAARAARSLNRHLGGRGLHAVGFRTTLRAQASQAAPTCQVLDLILGPLHLDLLGLVVDLYGPDKTKPVQVTVTADPNGGVLGATFCRLANSQ